MGHKLSSSAVPDLEELAPGEVVQIFETQNRRLVLGGPVCRFAFAALLSIVAGKYCSALRENW